jgi:choline transport protein
MNYAIVAFGIILLIAGGTWILDGRKHYEGPSLDIDGMMHGKVEGMEPTGTETTTMADSPVKEETPAKGH